jgi:hypothetical protein
MLFQLRAAAVMLAYPLTEKVLRRMVREMAQRRADPTIARPSVTMVEQVTDPVAHTARDPCGRDCGVGCGASTLTPATSWRSPATEA